MVKKYFGKFIPKKEWFDFDGDGNVDRQDFIAAAQNALNTLKPSANAFDVNGDGQVDINDALDAAKITGATIAGAGISVAAGAVAGSILVTGKATTIATVIAASIGAGASGGLATLLGSATYVSWAAWQTSSGVWILGVKSVTTVSPTLVTAVSGAGSMLATTANGAVKAIADFPVVQSVALKSLENSNEIIMIAGLPVVREVAISTALIAVVVVGGYALFVLTRKRVSKEEVQELVGPDGVKA